MSNIYSQRQQWTLLIVSIIIVGLFILYGIHQYTSAFLGSAILYMVFRPLFNYLVHKKHMNKMLTTILILVISLMVIVLPFLFLSVMLANKIAFYSNNLDEIAHFVNKVEQITGIQLQDKSTVQTLMTQGGSLAAELFPSLLSGTLDMIVIIALMYFTLFYMFLNQKGFVNGLHKYIPFDTQTLDELGTELQNIVNANVVGQGVISLIQGSLTGLGLYIFGFGDVIFWSTISFFLSFIPVLGTPLVWGPAAIIAIANGDTGQGVGLLLYGSILVINIDNLLRIFLTKRMGDIHPVVTLTGVILGVPIFGILGLVIGPLLIEYFIVLIRVFERRNHFRMVEDREEIISPADELHNEEKHMEVPPLILPPDAWHK